MWRLLTTEHQVEGFRAPVWLATKLDEQDRVPVQLALAGIEEKLKPGTPDHIRNAIKSLAQHWWKDREWDQWASLLVDFVADLREYSDAHISEAIAEYRKDAKWFPKTSELREICTRLQARSRAMRHRARVLLGLEQPAYYEIPAKPETDDTKVYDLTAVLESLAASKKA